MPNLSRYKEAPNTLKKLVLIQLAPDQWRAEYMTRNNGFENWAKVWRIDGSLDRVRSYIMSLNFI